VSLIQWIATVATAAQLNMNAHVLGMKGSRTYAGSSRSWAKGHQQTVSAEEGVTVSMWSPRSAK